MTQSANKPIKKSHNLIIKSFKHAINGVKHVFKNERNFRLHILSSVLVLILAFYFDCDLIEFAFLTIIIAIVLVSEMINSAIEYTWDKLEPNHHPVVGVIKDTMAGSVLIASISAFIIGIIIVLRHLI